MVLVLDTRFLVVHAIPPSQPERAKIKKFASRLAGEKLVVPSIVVVEFLKVAGQVLGRVPAETRLRLWVKGGAEIHPIDEEDAFLAGRMALRYREVPMADIIIGAVAKRLGAKVVSDDAHFEDMGIKRLWYR